jgi:hypothetical protein
MEWNEYTVQAKTRNLYKTWWKNRLQNGRSEAEGHGNVMKVDTKRTRVREDGS